MIYLDISSMYRFRPSSQNNQPYLKLINRRDRLPFKVEESYTLAEQNIIGRSPKNEIVLNDPYISGIHARIWEAGGVYFMEDLGSKNGSYLNGERISGPFTLRNGDRISLGQVEFLFVSEQK
ncbi:MAG: FHA domain-containing protein [Bacillota bacterium]